jgi:mRNA interferase MazF
VVIERGDVWWADLGDPGGSEAGFRRPVVVVQADAFNRSKLKTVVAVVLTTNMRLVEAPGNVLILPKASGLPRDSVANVSQLITVDRTFLIERTGRLRGVPLRDIDSGLRLVLSL